MTPARTDALIASAYNLAASEDPLLRCVHPSGMRPADAASLPKSVRRGWIESYALRLHAGKISEPLFNASEVQSALDAS